jgi:hypothetical protein
MRQEPAMSPALLDQLAEAALLGVHVLGGGVWIGAMVFSIFILQPRAEQFFRSEADFEDFIFSVVHGARWKVFSGIVAILLSGIGLAVWPKHAIVSESPLWLGLFVGKLAAFVIAAGLFIYVSWVLWPRRTFATPDELPAIKRHFFRVGAVMVVANAINMLLGIGAHVLR